VGRQDRLIIATAIPQITDDFKSVTDIGWYGSAYLLSTCAFQLLFGKLYTFYSIKAVFLTTVFLFEVGSAICGAAPTSVAFIIGRAIAGLGAAGIFSGVVRASLFLCLSPPYVRARALETEPSSLPLHLQHLLSLNPSSSFFFPFFFYPPLSTVLIKRVL